MSLLDTALKHARRKIPDGEASACIDAIEAACRAEIRERDALICKVRNLVRAGWYGTLHTPWHSTGRCIYNGDDYGSIVAEFQDTDAADQAAETVAAVNALDDIRRLVENAKYGTTPSGVEQEAQ